MTYFVYTCGVPWHLLKNTPRDPDQPRGSGPDAPCLLSNSLSNLVAGWKSVSKCGAPNRRWDSLLVNRKWQTRAWKPRVRRATLPWLQGTAMWALDCLPSAFLLCKREGRHLPCSRRSWLGSQLQPPAVWMGTFHYKLSHMPYRSIYVLKIVPQNVYMLMISFM